MHIQASVDNHDDNPLALCLQENLHGDRDSLVNRIPLAPLWRQLGLPEDASIR
jgi:hypothetical protein